MLVTSCQSVVKYFSHNTSLHLLLLLNGFLFISLKRKTSFPAFSNQSRLWSFWMYQAEWGKDSVNASRWSCWQSAVIIIIIIFLPEVSMIPQAIQTISGDVTDYYYFYYYYYIIIIIIIIIRLSFIACLNKIKILHNTKSLLVQEVCLRFLPIQWLYIFQDILLKHERFKWWCFCFIV